MKHVTHPPLRRGPAAGSVLLAMLLALAGLALLVPGSPASAETGSSSTCTWYGIDSSGDTSAQLLKKYSASYAPHGGTAPYSWSLTGDLPPGLEFASSGDTATVSGTPTKTGTYSYQITLVDAAGPSSCSPTLPVTTKVTNPLDLTTNPTLKQVVEGVLSVGTFVTDGCLLQVIDVLTGQLPKGTCT